MTNKRLTVAIVATGWLVCLLMISASRPALADWSIAGVQYSCDQQHQSFELLPYERTSSDPEAAANSGFKIVKEGHPSITCQLGTHILRAKMDIYPPAAQGQCMGGGFVRADSISVSDVELLPNASSLGWDCPGADNDLIRVRIVITGGQLSVQRCYQSSSALGRQGCSTEQMLIDVVAKERAHELNDLAPPDVQAAQSASKMRSDANLANVFRSPAVTVGPEPICAHMVPPIPRLGDVVPGMSATTPTGRVSGTSNLDRVYIHPENPQVCDVGSEPRCKATAYLIPGDRVYVHELCGAWAYINYKNARAFTSGWIPISRLYGISSLNSSDPARWKSYWTRFRNKDALYKAVATLDAQEVHRLLAEGGQQFNMLDALGVATFRGDPTLVSALLSGPIDVPAHCTQIMENAEYTTPAALDELRRKGLDIGCRKDALPALAGLDRLRELDFELSIWGSWDPMRDLPGRVQELLSAGVPVDSLSSKGQPGLIATIKPNNVDVAKLLLKNGANPNFVLTKGSQSGDSGLTPLIEAVEAYPSLYDPTMVRVLLEGGAAPNYRTAGAFMQCDPDDRTSPCAPLAGITALDIAAENGDLPIVQMLLAYGADPRLARSDGALPIDIARSNHHEAVAKLIADHSTKN